METGKERIGMEIWLAVRNPNYGEETCPCCGRKLSKKQDKYILVEGYYNKVECDGEDLFYYAEYDNELTDETEEALINRRWLGDYIDGGCYEEDEQSSHFVRYLKDISIFDLEYAGDEGDYAFKTEEEAKKWIKDFGKD